MSDLQLIRQAINGIEQDEHPEEPAGVQYVDFVDLFTKPREPVRWYAAPLAAAGRVTTLYSPGKTGKSLIAMEVAAGVATGMPVLGSPAGEPVPVLYIDQEMTPEDWHDRLEDMGYGVDDAAILNDRLHLAQLQSWPPMDTWTGGQAVLFEQQRWDARLVVIDTASKVTKGEENANDTHAAFYRNTLVPLKRAGCAVIVLDHTGKDVDRGARGGSAKTDNVDLAFELLLRGHNALSLRCSHARFKDPELDEPAFIRRMEHPLRHVIEAHQKPVGKGPGARPTVLMERLSRYIEVNPELSQRAIFAAVSGREEYKRLAMELLSSEGYVHVSSGGVQARSYTSVNPYRQEDE